MNFRIVGKYLGLLILFLGLNQLAPLVCAALYREGIPALDFVLSISTAAAASVFVWPGPLPLALDPLDPWQLSKDEA